MLLRARCTDAGIRPGGRWKARLRSLTASAPRVADSACLSRGSLESRNVQEPALLPPVRLAAPVTAIFAGILRPGAGPSSRSDSGGWAGPAGGAGSGRAGVAQDERVKDTAPTEAGECTMKAGLEATLEVLVYGSASGGPRLAAPGQAGVLIALLGALSLGESSLATARSWVHLELASPVADSGSATREEGNNP